jgi:hypothetical protein
MLRRLSGHEGSIVPQIVICLIVKEKMGQFVRQSAVFGAPASMKNNYVSAGAL